MDDGGRAVRRRGGRADALWALLGFAAGAAAGAALLALAAAGLVAAAAWGWL